MTPVRSATRLPRGRLRISPIQGSQRSKTWWSRPVPRVSVRNSVRKPTSPRAGTRYSMRAQPVPWLTICSSRPLRSARSWVTTPRNSSGTSIEARSSGSQSSPSISRVSTSGLPTVSSKPSRRIVSTSTASWSSPRPWTSQASGRSVGSTRSDTLPTSSCSSRSSTCRAVSRPPSRPASGEVLMPIGQREARLVDRDRPAAAAGRPGRPASRRWSPRPGRRRPRSRPGPPTRRSPGRAPR